MSNQFEDFRIQINRQSILIMGLLFSLLLVYIAFVGVDDVLSSLFQANFLLLLLAIVIYYSSLIIRSFRWKLFLTSLTRQNNGNISYWSVYSLITFSFALNNLFPLRIGGKCCWINYSDSGNTIAPVVAPVFKMHYKEEEEGVIPTPDLTFPISGNI